MRKKPKYYSKLNYKIESSISLLMNKRNNTLTILN